MTFLIRERGELLPVILIQPGSEQEYADLVRLARGEGFARPSAAEWQRRAFSAAMPVQVDVADGLLARVHFAGVAKSVVPAAEQPLTALWMAAVTQMVTAQQIARVLVVVTGPDTFGPPFSHWHPVGGPQPSAQSQQEMELHSRLAAAAGQRRLWAALAEVHVDRVRRVAGVSQVRPR